MEVNKKELKEQEIRTLFITPALQQKGWAVSVNMREEFYGWSSACCWQPTFSSRGQKG